MAANNIHLFKGNPTVWDKLIITLAYLVLGFTVTKLDPSTIFSIYILLAIVYKIVIQAQRDKLKYFLRFHVLQALLMNLCLSLLIWLLVMGLQFFATIPGLTFITTTTATFLFNHPVVNLPLAGFYPSFVNIVVMSVAIAVSIYGIKGQLTEVPYISEAVRRFE